MITDTSRAGERLRQDRSGRARPRPGLGRGGGGLHRGNRGPAPGERGPGDRRERGDRVSRVSGRTGEDPASQGPRRDPGRPLQARAPRADPKARGGADRPGGGEPLSLRGGGGARGHRPRRTDRGDRHRGADHPPGRVQERRSRGAGVRPRRLSRGDRRSGWGRDPGGSFPSPRGQGVHRHRGLRCGHRRPARPRAGGAADALPSRLPLGLRRVAQLRYGENPHQRGALYRPAGLPAGRAGRPGPAPGEGAFLQQLPGSRRRLPAGRRLHPGDRGGGEAPEPLRGGVRRGRGEGLPAGAGRGPGERLRGHRGPQPPPHRRRGLGHEGDLPGVHRGPGGGAGRPGGAGGQEEPPGGDRAIRRPAPGARDPFGGRGLAGAVAGRPPGGRRAKDRHPARRRPRRKPRPSSGPGSWSATPSPTPS